MDACVIPFIFKKEESAVSAAVVRKAGSDRIVKLLGQLSICKK